MEEENVNDELLRFSQDIVNYNQRTADYYESKKYHFLMTSMALLGFGATFISISQGKLFLIAAGVVLIISALISVFVYATSKSSTPEIKKKFTTIRYAAYGVDPKKSLEDNYQHYRAWFKDMTKKDMLEDNISHAFSLALMYENKNKTITWMSIFMTMGLIGFVILVILHVLQFYMIW